MKLTAFGATKKTLLHTDSPQNNQNTDATKAGYFFSLSGGDNHKLELNNRKLEKKKMVRLFFFLMISIVPFSQ